MKYLKKLTSLALWLMSCTCAWAQPVSIVPQPAHIEQQNGSLTLRADMTMAYSADCEPQAEYLRKAILGATAYNWSTAKKKSRADVVLEIDARRVTAAEGYNLTVDRRGITICAHDNGGLFYGIQTLLQLLPPAIHSKALQPDVTWQVPYVSISDAPNRPWRGMMLDVARYFFDKEFVKHYI